MSDKSKPVFGRTYEAVVGSNVSKGTLVAMIQADVAPTEEQVKRYFGRNAPKSANDPSPVYRAVLQKANGHYFIVPLVPNRKLVQVD